jgi:hypothetical protein
MRKRELLPVICGTVNHFWISVEKTNLFPGLFWSLYLSLLPSDQKQFWSVFSFLLDVCRSFLRSMLICLRRKASYSAVACCGTRRDFLGSDQGHREIQIEFCFSPSCEINRKIGSIPMLSESCFFCDLILPAQWICGP